VKKLNFLSQRPQGAQGRPEALPKELILYMDHFYFSLRALRAQAEFAREDLQLAFVAAGAGFKPAPTQRKNSGAFHSAMIPEDIHGIDSGQNR
jgi:hypothetical protein